MKNTRETLVRSKCRFTIGDIIIISRQNHPKIVKKIRFDLRKGGFLIYVFGESRPIHESRCINWKEREDWETDHLQAGNYWIHK